jgi:hypothetical protein
MNLFQNQCLLHTSSISSMGTPLVSGTYRSTKNGMKKFHTAKKTKKPHLREHNMVKNDSTITKLNKKFTDTPMLSPADLVSSGKISLGINHSHGPHDQDHPTTNKHTNTTKMIASECDKRTSSCNPYRRIIAIATCIMNYTLSFIRVTSQLYKNGMATQNLFSVSQ